MNKRWIKQIVCTALFGSSLIFSNAAEAGVVTDRLPLQCYADHKILTFNTPGAARSAGWISANVDLIQIKEVRSDGWCFGSYPGSGGKKVSRWFKITDVCADPGYTNRNAQMNTAQKAYRTAFINSTIGSVSKNESVVVIADNGSRAQILYKLDNGTGYKLGWVPSSSLRYVSGNHNPVGAFETYGTLDNALRVIGWAEDADDLNHKVRVHVYIGGAVGDANAYSKELVANKGGNSHYGHVFDETLWNIPARYCGKQIVRIYALNDVGPGAFQEIGSQVIDIPSKNNSQNHNPRGVFETYGTLDNALRVIGWAIDDDDPNYKVRVHVYIGGSAGDANAYSKEIRADKDNNTSHGHGFDETLWNIPDKFCGRQTVKIYALNDVGAGALQEIGSKVIDIPARNLQQNQYRNNALRAAKEMVDFRWTAPCDFVTWCSSKGVYNKVVDENGRSDTMFRKGRIYTGVPYSMKNRTYTRDKFLNYLYGHTNRADYEDTYYGHGKTTTKIGIDCSYFVWWAINNSGSSIKIGGNYTTTSTLLNSRLFSQRRYADMKPGDIFLKKGSHVMMLAEKLSNGNCVVYEADAGDSKCSKNTYNPNSLINSGYVGYTFNGYGD